MGTAPRSAWFWVNSAKNSKVEGFTLFLPCFTPKREETGHFYAIFSVLVGDYDYEKWIFLTHITRQTSNLVD